MKSIKHIFLSLAIIALTASMLAQAQSDRPSPPGTAEVQLEGKAITIRYSRPSIRGRQIMGGLVPYGEVWRTGANEATALTTPVDLEIGGTPVPAGSYTIYSLPSAGTWKLIINKQTGQWGTDYDERQDLARINLIKSTLSSPREKFTIEFVKKSTDTANLVLEWETTKLTVPVRAK